VEKVGKNVEKAINIRQIYCILNKLCL
jgi:hypothetical protein